MTDDDTGDDGADTDTGDDGADTGGSGTDTGAGTASSADAGAITGPFDRRPDDCRAALSALDPPADAVVLFPGPNLQYLTGFDEAPAERHLLLFVTADGTHALVPELYESQFLAETHLDRASVTVHADADDAAAVLRAVLADLGLTDADRLLVDDRLWATFLLDLRAAAPDADLGLASEVLADLRICKDDAELAAMSEAAAVADEVSRAVRAMGADAVGTTERELAREIARRLEAAGGAGTAFPVIVGSGPNGAMPHHDHGDRRIEAGDPVVLDFGTLVDGYPSDQTRTVVFDGDPPEGFREAHEAVRAAQDAAVAAVEPGVPAAAVDRAAREVIERRGFGEEFVHRTGHGVGLEVHEPPYVVGDSDRRLERGMVFSVEPGVYRDGEFGVRVEDLVVVTADGCRRLNDSPRGWRPL